MLEGGFMISRSEALKLIEEWIRNDKIRKHVYAVEAIMKGLAKYFNEDENLWGLVGLLHDLDYDKTKNNMPLHTKITADFLKNKLPQEALEAIMSHNELSGVKPESKMAYALIASDQISGLIIATALVMPHKKLEEVKVKSVLKKFKQKDFARNIRRDKITMACERLGIELRKLVEISLEALKQIHEILGL